MTLTTTAKLYVGGLLLAGGLVWWGTRPGPKPIVTNPLPNTTVVTTQGPVTTKLVTQFITDPAQAKLMNDLLAENARLKLTVGTLTSTVAKLESKGGLNVNGGTITQLPSTTMALPGVSAPQTVDNYSFKDFQLNANYTSDGKGFNYTVSQDLRVVTTTGKDKNGAKLSIVKVFQTTPQGPVEVSSVTTEIQTTDNPTKWWISPRIQGGLKLGVGSGETKAGVVAFQWLKRGTSRSAEDTTFSLLSPGVTFGPDGAKLTLLPVSVNLGRIPHQPLTNLWVSPTLDLNKTLGIAFTATF